MKRIIVIAAIAALGALPATASASTPAKGSPEIASISRSCSSGYRHARTPGGHKCLRAGQFCSRSRAYQRAYKRVGYRCKRSGRLVRRRR